VRHEFQNTTAVTIDPGPPGTVTSAIEVSGVDGGAVQDVDVLVDIEHTWTGDLTINLLSPSGQRVVLVDRRGGNRDHFTDTEFDSDAEVSIANASPPYRGTFKPEGDLGELRNRPANGKWALEVSDRAFQDGGAIREWGLAITTGSPAASAFDIDVRFLGGLTDAQKSAFDVAATRWSELIVGDLPDVVVDGQTVDDVRIDAEGVAIDGPGKILGQAGPTRLRPGSFLPATGVMSFDTADLAQMEADGSLVRVIMHEMAHVLGFGTIWDRKGLLQGAGTANPTFTGAGAIREFAALRGETSPLAVPVANQGGPGTRDSHWREQVFGNELMTGFLNGGVNPISRLSVAGLEDLGYEVSYDAADPYTLPSALMIAIMGVGAEAADHGEHGMMLIPHQAVLPEDALVDG
jgi:subtilisin-like proprotein convertase family protein